MIQWIGTKTKSIKSKERRKTNFHSTKIDPINLTIEVVKQMNERMYIDMWLRSLLYLSTGRLYQ